MDAQEFLKKYGIYIVGGAVVLYLVLKNTASGRSAAVSAAAPNALELAKLQQQGQLAAGQLGLEQAKLQQQLELAQLKAQSDAQARADTIALYNRALANQQRQGMLSAISNAIAGILKSITGAGSGSQSKGGTSGGSQGGFGTPPIAGTGPQRSLPARALSSVQLPNVSLPDIPLAPAPSYGGPFYQPTFEEPGPPPEWGGSPDVSNSGVTYDSGYTFNDQGNFYGGDLYGNAIDWSGAGSAEPGYSELPEATIPPAGQPEGIPAEEYTGQGDYLTTPDYFTYDYGGGGDYTGGENG